jgi:hypothetical protein
MPPAGTGAADTHTSVMAKAHGRMIHRVNSEGLRGRAIAPGRRYVQEPLYSRGPYGLSTVLAGCNHVLWRVRDPAFLPVLQGLRSCEIPCGFGYICIAPGAGKVPHLSHIPPPFFAEVRTSDVAAIRESDVLICTVSTVVHPVALTPSKRRGIVPGTAFAQAFVLHTLVSIELGSFGKSCG